MLLEHANLPSPRAPTSPLPRSVDASAGHVTFALANRPTRVRPAPLCVALFCRASECANKQSFWRESQTSHCLQIQNRNAEPSQQRTEMRQNVRVVVPNEMSNPDALASLRRAAEAQMRRRAPVDLAAANAGDDADEAPLQKRMKSDVDDDAETVAAVEDFARYEYAPADGLLTSDEFTGGFVVTCAFGREKSATADALRMLNAAAESGARLKVAKLPCRGALLVMLGVPSGSGAIEDATRMASKALESVRSGVDPGSRFVEKIYPVNAAFDLEDDARMASACAEIIRAADLRVDGLFSREELRFAVAYAKRLCNDAVVSNEDAPGAHKKSVLVPRVARAIEDGLKKTHPNVTLQVDLKRPDIVVFLEVLTFLVSDGKKKHVVAMSACAAEDKIFVVKSRGTTPESISSFMKPPEPKWMQKKRALAEQKTKQSEE